LDLLRQDKQFAAQLGKSVILRVEAETCCLIADPGKSIPAKINNFVHFQLSSLPRPYRDRPRQEKHDEEKQEGAVRL
jgi:hypothetical protein